MMLLGVQELLVKKPKTMKSIMIFKMNEKSDMQITGFGILSSGLSLISSSVGV